MSDPPVFSAAVEAIRAARTDEALGLLTEALPRLHGDDARKAKRYLGLANYFAGRWDPALAWFQQAAEGSEVPEDWFNVAMAQVKAGDPAAGSETWQRVFDLSYRHKEAPETSTFFQKKALFAEALRDAGACNEVGLDLLERQLLPFFTRNRVTDPSFWGMRGVPAFHAVMALLSDYYRMLGKPREAWLALLTTVGGSVDEEGRAYCEELAAQAWPVSPA